MVNALRLLLVIILLLAGRASLAVAQDQAQQAIEDRVRAFVTAFNAKDAAAIASLYTEDATLFPPGAMPITGRSAIRKFWQEGIDSGLSNITLKPTEIASSGDLAYEVGVFVASIPGKDGKRMTLAGKYIVLWKRERDGTWRLHRDIWNESPAK
jgi:uncharacterized protein (TIGR02246 family)